jgi:hypothetical protein
MNSKLAEKGDNPIVDVNDFFSFWGSNIKL